MALSNPPDVRSSNRELDRFAAARDLWPGGTLETWKRGQPPGPDRVFWPENEAEVEAVLRWASESRTPVVPYGAGSGVCGGARGRPGTIVLDCKALDDIGEVDVDSWTVEAGAGVNGQLLEDHLNARGFTLGHSPSSIWCSTVGGWAAARSAGQFSSRYGVFEDMVVSLRAVSAGRGAFSVGPQGDAPASWMSLLLGSEGTLAIITSVTMRVWPLPATRWLRGYRFSDVGTALRAMRLLMQSELWPSVVRLYDPVDTRIGGKTKPKSERKASNRSFLRKLLSGVERVPKVRKRTLALPLALPGLINKIADRLASGVVVIVGWEGRTPLVEAMSAAGHEILCRDGEDLGPGPGERWFNSRHAVSYKLMPIFERGGFADTMEVAHRWSELEPMYHRVRKALQQTTVCMAHMSHVYPEGGCIYFSFAGLGSRETYEETWRNALEAVLASGGTVTHHHGVGELKAGAVRQEIGPAIDGWRALKSDLDPAGVMNPGRLYRDEGPLRDPGAPPRLAPEDGLVRCTVDSSLEERRKAAAEAGGELMWPWDRLPAPPRWQRPSWQMGWTEVAGTVDAQRCVLGRGPRSASGPDLRGWLADSGTDVSATLAVAPDGARWMGTGKPRQPWRVARELLRNELRPAILTVEDGTLFVGFRGPAAAALGGIASSWVPGGLTEAPWRDFELYAGPMAPCAADAEGVVAVLPEGWLGRVSS